MVVIRVEVKLEGLERKLDTLAEAAEDLDKPLRAFGGYLRKKAIERYKAQNFAPLAESTIEKRQQKGLRSLERKLARDVRRAMKRSRLARGPQKEGVLERLLTSSQVRKAAQDAVSAESRGVRNRRSVLAEFQKRHRRDMKDRVEGSALSLKQAISLGGREDRAVAKAVGKPILGSLPNSLKVEVGDGVVTLASRTEKPFTEIHNKGGSAGHGATLPQRETIKVDSDDLDVLVRILIEHHLMVPFQES